MLWTILINLAVAQDSWDDQKVEEPKPIKVEQPQQILDAPQYVIKKKTPKKTTYHERYEWDSGRVYDGEWMEFPDGSWPHGQGTMHYTNGLTCTGNWEKGYLNGRDIVCESEQYTFVGEYDTGKRISGDLFFTHGASYNGKFQDFAYHGFGTYTYANGDILEGEWFEDDLQDGGTRVKFRTKGDSWSSAEVYVGDWELGDFNDDIPMGYGKQMTFKTRSLSQNERKKFDVPDSADQALVVSCDSFEIGEGKWDGYSMVYKDTYYFDKDEEPDRLRSLCFRDSEMMPTGLRGRIRCKDAIPLSNHKYYDSEIEVMGAKFTCKGPEHQLVIKTKVCDLTVASNTDDTFVYVDNQLLGATGYKHPTYCGSHIISLKDSEGNQKYIRRVSLTKGTALEIDLNQ